MQREKIINKLPETYRLSLENVVETAKSLYKDELIAIFLAGSAGRGKVIENWSDIDIYLITKSFNTEKNNLFNYISEKNNSIHIGTTFYTEKMVNKMNVDSKTIATFYEYKHYNINTFIYGNINIKDISFNQIVNNNKNLNDLIQITQRELSKYIYDKNNHKNLIKKITLLIKLFIIMNYNKYVYNYNAIFDAFNNLTNTNINIDIEKIIDRKYILNSELDYFSYILKRIVESR